MTKMFLISSSIAAITAAFVFTASPAGAQWDDGPRRGGSDYGTRDDYRPHGRHDDDDYGRRPQRYPDRDRYPDRTRYPDRDHDGIPDYRDRIDNRYPDRRPRPDYPDRDGDGIPDYLDRTDNRYPDRSRLSDRDHDGIPDYRDHTDNRYPDRGSNTRPLPRPYPDRDPPRETNKDRWPKDDVRPPPKQTDSRPPEKSGSDDWDKSKKADDRTSGQAQDDWDKKKDSSGCSGYGCGADNPKK
jgi:hypothetical protein